MGKKNKSNKSNSATESQSLLSAQHSADTSSYGIDIDNNTTDNNQHNNNNDKHDRHDSWNNTGERMTSEEFADHHNKDHDIADDADKPPYHKYSDEEKLQINVRQRNMKLLSSLCYIIASACCIAESALSFICTEHECEKDDTQVYIWYAAEITGVATGVFFLLGAILHVICDHEDVYNEGGVERSRWDSLIAVLSSWASVAGAVAFAVGSGTILYNGPNHPHTAILLSGQVVTVIGSAAFFFGLLCERAATQMKLIDVVEVGKHHERPSLLWDMTATIIFCQFEVLFLVGAIVAIWEDKMYTQLGEILWIVSGAAFLFASGAEYIAAYKHHV